MGSFKSLIKTISTKSKLVSILLEKDVLASENKRFLSEARQLFKSHPEHGSMEDYQNALKKHRITVGEYMYKFEYWNLNEQQRDEFISCSEMQCIYRKMIHPEVKAVFINKILFLNKFSEFIQRQWLEVRKSSYEDFYNMLRRFDCIAKPIEGRRGHGIHLIKQISEGENVKPLYDECVKNNVLLEERVHACKEIEEFHPNSLNTIRVVTISNPDKVVVFGAILRMGKSGSIIDNTHNGGIFASIDVKTGVIDTDGIDSLGNTFEVHPDSKKKIKGFQIPHWDKVLATCSKATKVLPNLIYAGWDVVVMDGGKIIMIEGNHGPDFDGGMQAPKKIGVKQRVKNTVMDLYGVDPLQFISVTSGPYIRK